MPHDTESNHTSIKSKHGRKPAHESRSVEIRQRIREWKAVSPDERQPATLTQLARELGISHQLASYYHSSLLTTEELWSRIYSKALATLAEIYDHGTDRQRRQVRQVLKGSPARPSTDR